MRSVWAWTLFLICIRLCNTNALCSGGIKRIERWQQVENFCGGSLERGVLPASIGQLTRLTKLSLQYEAIQTLPESFGNLTMLTRLNLRGNELQTLPESFGQLTRLTKLVLAMNNMQVLPESFGNLKKLKILDLRANQLESLPESFRKLRIISDLRIENNRITRLPQLEKNMFLRTLAIHNNPFACDRSSLGWFQAMNSNKRLRILNSDDAQCNGRNEFEGFPLHRLRFVQDEPETHPEWNNALCQSESPNTLMLHWTFPGFSPGTLWGDFVPNATGFDCNSIQQQKKKVVDPWLIFQVEWRHAGQTSSPWNSLCTGNMPFTITDLKPNTLYDIRVRGIHVRWDVYVDEEQISPRLSAGPRANTLQLKTNPDVPDGAPQNVREDSNRTRETSLVLQWDPPAVPNSDNIWYTLHKDGQVLEEKIWDTTFFVDGLEPGSMYTFQLSSSSEVGQGNFSDPFNVWTKETCPLGSQRVESEEYVCEACPLDTYRSEATMKECLKCPAIRPHTLSSGTMSMSDCVDGSKFLELESNSISVRQINQGFWRISVKTLDFLACPRPEYCKPDRVKNLLGTSVELTVPDKYCTQDHTGILCASCVDGLVRKNFGCKQCHGEENARDVRILKLWCAFGVLVVLGPCAVVLVHSLSKGSSDFGHCRPKPPMLDEKAKENIAVVFRIFIGFLQVFFQYNRALEIPALWGGGVDALVNLDISAMLERLDVGCAWETNFYDSLLLYTAFPVASISVEFLFMFLCWPCNQRRASTLGLSVWLVLQLLFFVYPGVSAVVFKTFRFEEFPKWFEDPFPNRTLAADYTIDFDTETSRWWRRYASIMIALYPVGVVLLFGAMVWVGKRVSMKKSPSDVDDAIAESVAFLSKPYNWEYFECYELVRKLLLTSGFLLVQQESRGGAQVFFLALSLLFLSVFHIGQPYRSLLNNAFAILSSFLLVVLGLIPLSLQAIDELSSHTTKRDLVMGAAAVECAAACFSILGHLWVSKKPHAHSQSGQHVDSSQILGDSTKVSQADEPQTQNSVGVV